MKKLWQKPGFRDGLKLFGVYLLLHGLMLVLTGTFHDDWVNWFKDPVTKDLEGIQSGRPYYAWVIELVWLLPGYGYRILAFLTYFAAYDFLYLTLSRVPEIRRQEAFLIAAITMAVPVNDARVLLANYPYALGMLLFWIGAWMLAGNIGRLNRIGIRLGVLAVFFLSFTLNSNLVMYGGVLLYLMIRFRPREWVRYLDFVALPIVFYALGKALFPVYGLEYEEYNLISLGGLVWAVASIPATVRNILLDMANMVLADNTAFMAALAGAAAWGGILFLTRKRRAAETDSVRERSGEAAAKSSSGQNDRRELMFTEEEAPKGNRDLVIFLFGLVLLIAGFFPYTAVRQRTYLALTGVNGRDSMLLGVGTAMMLFSLPIRSLRRPLAVFAVILGICHFGNWYMNYQAEWYRQLAFQHDVAGIEDIAVGGNYVVKVSEDSAVEDRRFYTWSGNAAAATGKRTAFLFNGDGNAEMLQKPANIDYVVTHYPMFTDYRYHPEVDGTLYFNVRVSREDTIQLKMQELFNRSGFEQRIGEIGDVDYVKALAEKDGET